MSDATADFLSGQGIPVALHDLEAELHRLWGPASDQAGGPEVENPTVTRVVLSNLVMFAKKGDADKLLGVLDTVASRFPSRTIVMERSEGGGRSIRSEVSALCHIPTSGAPPVCSERILLKVSEDATDLLPGAVRPILEPELPFILWWTDDPRKDEALYVDLADECSRLILDLPDLEADPAAIRFGLDPKHCPHTRDASWFALFRWRELVAQFFDPACHIDALTRIESVKIEVAVKNRPGAIPPRSAIWLAAWFAGQLDWKPAGSINRESGSLKARFESRGGPVSLEIVTETDGGLEEGVARIRAVTIETRAAEAQESGRFKLRRPSLNGPEVRVEVDSASSCSLPRTLSAPEPDHAQRVAAALESSRIDPPFQNARPHALWLMES